MLDIGGLYFFSRNKKSGVRGPNTDMVGEKHARFYKEEEWEQSKRRKEAEKGEGVKEGEGEEQEIREIGGVRGREELKALHVPKSKMTAGRACMDKSIQRGME